MMKSLGHLGHKNKKCSDQSVLPLNLPPFTASVPPPNFAMLTQPPRELSHPLPQKQKGCGCGSWWRPREKRAVRGSLRNPLRKQSLFSDCFSKVPASPASLVFSMFILATILKLLVIAGEKCERIMAQKIRNVEVRDVELDEVWSFIGKKQKRV